MPEASTAASPNTSSAPTIRPTEIHKVDTLVLGAGAAGMMCAANITKGTVAVLDHAKKPGEKIRISGGGRCNFTNRRSNPQNFLSQNRHFAKSALAAYTPEDFIALVEKYDIAFHEKTLGQLFCDGSAQQIIQMLLEEMANKSVKLHLKTDIGTITRRQTNQGTHFEIATSMGVFHAHNIVVATGGKSIPKMGATSLGYQIAEQFDHDIIPPRPALVPFTWPDQMVEQWKALSGVALPVIAQHKKTQFKEAMLMTHRGLSGPAILQISSYWREGETVNINLLPEHNALETLKTLKETHKKSSPVNALTEYFPKRLAQQILNLVKTDATRMGEISNKTLQEIAAHIQAFAFMPGGTEGYRTAEVTLGGVNTKKLNQKTMESFNQEGVYFIGEVVDVTGHLGGHNFQWAWASAVAAARAISQCA